MQPGYSIFQKVFQVRLTTLQFGLGALSLDGKGDVARDDEGELRFCLRKAVWRIIIDHEFTDDPPLVSEREEAKRADAFAYHGGLQLAEAFIVGNILDEHGLRVRGIRTPRGMPFRCL